MPLLALSETRRHNALDVCNRDKDVVGLTDARSIGEFFLCQ